MLRGMCLAVLFAVVSVLVGGCGGSSSSKNSSASAPKVASPTVTSSSGTLAGRQSSSSGVPSAGSGGSASSEVSAKPAHLPSGAVALVDGVPIPTIAYTHQLQIGTSGPAKSLIADPSNYSACIAAVKSEALKTEKFVTTREHILAKIMKRPVPVPRTTPKTEAQRKQECDKRYREDRLQAVNVLIRRIWTKVQAKELGVGTVTNKVSNEMVTDQILDRGIAVKIAEKFAQPGAVSQAKLEQYFNEHKQAYRKPEERRFEIFHVKSQTQAEQAKEELSSGKNFAKVAASVTKSKFTGTSHESFRCGAAPSEPVMAMACTAKKGVPIGPIKISSEYEVFEIVGILPAVQATFGQEKEQIKQQLLNQSGVPAKVKYNEETRVKQKEKTECAAGYVTFLCKEYQPPKPVSLPLLRPGRVTPAKSVK